MEMISFGRLSHKRGLEWSVKMSGEQLYNSKGSGEIVPHRYSSEVLSSESIT